MNWLAYFRELLTQDNFEKVNKESVTAPINYAPPVMQKKYKKRLWKERKLRE